MAPVDESLRRGGMSFTGSNMRRRPQLVGSLSAYLHILPSHAYDMLGPPRAELTIAFRLCKRARRGRRQSRCCIHRCVWNAYNQMYDPKAATGPLVSAFISKAFRCIKDVARAAWHHDRASSSLL